MHARWAIFLQTFCFVFKNRNEKLNVAVDALSRREYIMTIIKRQLICFEVLKDVYEDDEDFAEIWKKCVEKDYLSDYFLQGYLFKDQKLCFPRTFLKPSSKNIYLENVILMV